MLKTKFYTKLSLLAIFFSISNLSFAEEKDEILPSYNLEEEAKNLYVKSFFNKREEEIENESFEEKVNIRKRSFNLTPISLCNKTLRSLIFNNIIDFEKNWSSDKNVYNKYLLKDCSIFLGKNDNPKFNLLSRINRTKTIIGEATLSTLLTRPTTNIQELFNRQQTIKTFINFLQKDDTLDKILKTYGLIENSIVSLFSPRDPFYNLTLSQKIKNKFLQNDKSRNTISILGRNKILKRDFLDIFWPSFGLEILDDTLCVYRSYLDNFSYNIFPPVFHSLRYSSYHLFLNLSNNIEPFSVYFSELVRPACRCYSLYLASDKYVENDKILRGIAHRLYDVSILLRLSKKLTEVIERDEQLKKVLGDKIVSIKLLFQKINDDKTLKSIVNFLLNKHEMLRNLHYFADNVGYILFAYDNLELIKENIKNVIADIGVIDAYCSCANLFIENANKENHFVFATYIPRAQSKTPYIKFENLWNPFLDSEKAVPNKIEMGANSSTQCTNMILTGPNAGGKSTYIDSVVLAILMGQTIGFAPGNEILFTPFNKINSYIEVKDDVADGKSAFVAEVDRCFYHHEILTNLKENEFAFSVFDEPFRGTNPLEGSAVEYSIFEKIGGFKNSLNIIATHYPIMTLLEDKNFNLGFRNYKVYIKKDENDKILFTYKIIPGRAKQNIAIDILYQTGYKNEILKHAREIVRNPKLYETKFEDNKISQGKW